MQISTNNKIGVYAPSGYGKTYLVDKIIKSIKVDTYIYDTDLEASQGIYFKNMPHVKVFIPELTKSEDLGYLSLWLQEKLTLSNIFIYIEDIDLFFDINSQLNKKSNIIKYISSKGRHQRIGFIYSAKQLTHIPTKLRSNTNLFFFGAFNSEIELDKIKKIIGKKAFNDVYLKLNPSKNQFLMFNALSRECSIIRV